MTPQTQQAQQADPPTRAQPGQTSPRVLDRVPALSGAAFVVAVLAGNSLTETVAVAGDSPEATVRGLAAGAASTVHSAGLVLEVLGLLSLVLFGAVVAAVGRHLAPSPWPHLTVAAAALLAAVKLGSAAPYLAARELASTVEASTVHALVEVNEVAFVVTWLPMAVLVGACAATLHAARRIGRVTWALGLLLCLLGLVAGLRGLPDPGSAVPVPFLLSLLWTAVVSVRLAVTGGSRPAPAR